LFFFQIHIQKVLETASVIDRWTGVKGQGPTTDDIERIYEKSLTAMLDVLPANSHVIKGQSDQGCQAVYFQNQKS
jgi:hypothetical protein